MPTARKPVPMPVLRVSTELEPTAAGSSAPSCCLRAYISDTLCDRTLMPQPLATQLTHYSGHIKAFTVKTFTSCSIKAVALGVCRGGGIPAGVSLAGLENLCPPFGSADARHFCRGTLPWVWGYGFRLRRQSVLAAALAAPLDRLQPTDPSRAPSRSWARGSGGKRVQVKTVAWQGWAGSPGAGRPGRLEHPQ